MYLKGVVRGELVIFASGVVLCLRGPFASLKGDLLGESFREESRVSRSDGLEGILWECLLPSALECLSFALALSCGSPVWNQLWSEVFCCVVISVGGQARASLAVGCLVVWLCLAF